MHAQDPMFSQFYANPLYLAPSFAGASKKGTRVALNYRDQWPSIPRAFTTYSFSFDHYFDKIRSGAGLYFMNDRQGSTNLRMMNIGAVYSFDFQINERWHIRPGLHLIYFQSGIDYSRFKFYNQILPEQLSVDAPPQYEPLEVIRDIDAAASCITYNDLSWFGLTINHMLKPNIGLYGDSPYKGVPYLKVLKFSFFGGARFRLRGNLLKYYKESLTIAYLYEMQEKYKQFNIGAYYHKNPLVVGTWYRGIPAFKGNPGHDAMVFLVGYEISDYIRLGYSFDLTVSGLKPSSGGAHELSLVWNFKIKERKKKKTQLPCPDI
jgi:type IX secretion system PorP/SprF family membrane protein